MDLKVSNVKDQSIVDGAFVDWGCLPTGLFIKQVSTDPLQKEALNRLSKRYITKNYLILLETLIIIQEHHEKTN